MRTLLSRSFDLYRLKMRYRVGVFVFYMSGLLTGIFLSTLVVRGVKLSLANAGSEPHFGVIVPALGVLLIFLGSLGMAVGAFLYCLILSVFGPLTLRKALSAIFLSKYPESWFR